MHTKKVLVAGATGHLGQYVAKAFKDSRYHTEVLVRNPEKFRDLNIEVDKVITAEITKPETLKGICDGIDIVFCSIGIIRQNDKLTYHDVDYQGSLNLLNEAVKSGVKCFIYVSVFNGEQLQDVSKRSAIPVIALKYPGIYFCHLKLIIMTKVNREEVMALISSKPDGQRVKNFCAEKGITETFYYYWRNKLSKSKSETCEALSVSHCFNALDTVSKSV